jgi:hypothetical protein
MAAHKAEVTLGQKRRSEAWRVISACPSTPDFPAPRELSRRANKRHGRGYGRGSKRDRPGRAGKVSHRLRERSGRLGGVLDRLAGLGNRHDAFGYVGSVGAMVMHVDCGNALEEAVITITVKRLKLITTAARCHTPGGRHSRSIEKRECPAAEAIFKRTQVKESD